MFESMGGRGDAESRAADLRAWRSALAAMDTGADIGAVDDVERIDRIRALEELKAAAAAAQAREVAAFAVAQEERQRARGASAQDASRGIAGQVGLAKRESPFAARRFTGYARVLVTELPHTLAALTAGVTTERRAFLVAQHTVWLSREHRALVDAHVGPRLESWGDRQVETEVKKMAYRLDPAGFVERLRRAESERNVTLRPAPDTMTYLSALLPVADGVACKATLERVAAALIAAGDPRTRSQLMADLLVGYLTGRTHPDLATDDSTYADDSTEVDPDGSAAQDTDAPQNTAAPQNTGTPRDTGAPQGAEPGSAGGAPVRGVPAGVGVELQIVMTDEALFAGGDEPADVTGHGPVPAAWVRELLRATSADTRVWLRRFFRDPDTGDLAATDTRRREFTGTLRDLLIARDRWCRTPWCAAPIRHLDHITPHTDGGPTNLPNGQGLCENCNYTKQTPGWHTQPCADPAGRDITITTPTGHRYTSHPPDPPRQPAPPPRNDAGRAADRAAIRRIPERRFSPLETDLACVVAEAG